MAATRAGPMLARLAATRRFAASSRPHLEAFAAKVPATATQRHSPPPKAPTTATQCQTPPPQPARPFPRQRAFSEFVEHSTRPLRHGDLLFVTEPANPDMPLDGAVKGIGKATIEWLQNRGGGEISKPHHTVQHVGMVVADSFGLADSVVESQRVAGVRVLKLPEFFNEFPVGSGFYHAWLPEATEQQTQRAVAWALRRVGAQYAHDFSVPADNCEQPWLGKYYCSSLVDHAYRNALGEDRVFTEEPFPLLFEPRDFWEQFYREQNISLPTGYGSNPTLLMHSCRVRYTKYEPFLTYEECHELC